MPRLQGGEWLARCLSWRAGTDSFTMEVQKYTPARFTIECLQWLGGGHRKCTWSWCMIFPRISPIVFWPSLEIVNDSLSLRDVDFASDGSSPFFGFDYAASRGSLEELGTQESDLHARLFREQALLILHQSQHLPDRLFFGSVSHWLPLRLALFFTPNDIIDTEGIPQSAGDDGDIGFCGKRGFGRIPG